MLVGAGIEVCCYVDAEVSRQSVLEVWTSMSNAGTPQHYDGVGVPQTAGGSRTRRRRRGVPGCTVAA